MNVNNSVRRLAGPGTCSCLPLPLSASASAPTCLCPYLPLPPIRLCPSPLTPLWLQAACCSLWGDRWMGCSASGTGRGGLGSSLGCGHLLCLCLCLELFFPANSTRYNRSPLVHWFVVPSSTITAATACLVLQAQVYFPPCLF